MKFKTFLSIAIGLGLFSCLPGKSALAEIEYPFSGEINFVDKNLNILFDSQSQGKIDLKVSQESPSRYQLLLKAEHWKTRFFDLSSEIKSSIAIEPGESRYSKKVISGKMTSRYSLLDYRPVPDLDGTFKITGRELTVPYFFFGHVSLSGHMDLRDPFPLDFEVKLVSINMDDFLNFWVPNKRYQSDGDVYGTIQVSGKLDKIYLKGDLRSKQGFIKNFDYNMIHLDAEGYYPELEIVDSVVSQEDGMIFVLRGQFDLSDRKNFKKQIGELTLSPLVSNNDGKAEWTIKKLRDEGDGSTTELKYFLRSEEKDGLPKQDSSGMLGVERIFQF